ncbi:MAG: helix-turn-helix domain-containing protein [Rubrivivax sp.]|nr:helix-turn-helix domain-containing protein [Pyrinomonadaceae bacterium]
MNPKPPDQSPEGGERAGGVGGSLGEQLRRARDERGISLREISEHTRITMRHLEAIEADDFKNLPGGIFNKSFVKAYARYIKFDEARALDLYARTAREHGESVDEVATSPQRSRIYTNDPARSPLVTLALSAVIVGILILIVYAGLHYYRRTESPAENAAPTPAPVATPAGAQVPAPQPSPAPTDTLSVTVKVKGDVWMRALVDGETAKDKPGQTWKAGESQTFAPQERLTLNYARSLAGSLEVTANGSALKAPTDTKPGVQQEWVISRENYKQFAQ